jgi:formamidopyrimidine-DNA glycosylase
MPELPEVETVVRGLRTKLPSRRILDVRFGKTDFIANPVEIATALPGSRVARVERMGKFIVIQLEPPNGRPAARLFVHLGMTGRLHVQRTDAPVAKHTHAFFTLDDGRELRFIDPRRFGQMRLVAERDLAVFVDRLGAEPLRISETKFRALLAGRRTMLKALLLDQGALRGLGNIYADEALWRARLHPRRQASTVKPEEAWRLRGAIRAILQAAIRLGGSSISDFVDANGDSGEFQLRHRAYGREGKPCLRCRTRIRRVLVAGRSSHFCPSCQPAPRRAARSRRPVRRSTAVQSPG